MSQPGGQFSETRQTVLQPQLLFELDDRCEVAEQADRPLQRHRVVQNRRHGDPNVRSAARALAEFHVHGSANDRLPRPQAFVNRADQRRRDRAQQVAERTVERRIGQAEHASAGRIQNSDLPFEADDEETGGHAGDDLRRQPLGGISPRRAGPLLLLERGHRSLKGRGQERMFCTAVPHQASGLPRRGAEPQHGKDQDGDQAADDGGQAYQEVSGLRHGDSEGARSVERQVPSPQRLAHQARGQRANGQEGTERQRVVQSASPGHQHGDADQRPRHRR